MPAGVARLTEELCRHLRRYLDAHPGAADTTAGIRQWWLPQPLRHVAIEDLRRALALLVKSGEVRRIVLPDGTRLYARGPSPPAPDDREPS